MKKREFTTREMTDFLLEEFPQLKETFTRAEIEEALTEPAPKKPEREFSTKEMSEFIFALPGVERAAALGDLRRVAKLAKLGLEFPGLRLTDEQLDNYKEGDREKVN